MADRNLALYGIGYNPSVNAIIHDLITDHNVDFDSAADQANGTVWLTNLTPEMKSMAEIQYEAKLQFRAGIELGNFTAMEAITA